jgi:hypothetical protein
MDGLLECVHDVMTLTGKALAGPLLPSGEKVARSAG